MASSRVSRVKGTSDLLFVNFNQDNSCVSVGTRRGYSITNCEPVRRQYLRNDGAASIVEMLFCTSLVAVVGTGDTPSSSPRRLHVVNTKRQANICELRFPSTILSVKLNRSRLVVVIEEEIYIYDISNMKLLNVIPTSPNPNAICALSPSSENSYLAYPSPLSTTSTSVSTNPTSSSTPSTRNSGDVLLFDALSLSVTNIVQAHKSPLAFLSINHDGTLLATASDKGTVIRVFSIPNGEKVAQFRRGAYPAKIYSISFNSVSSLLCVSSDTETVHIYKLSRSGTKKNRSNSDASDDDPMTSSTAGSRMYPARSSSNGGYEAYIDSKRSEANNSKNSIRTRSLTFGRSVAGSVGGFLPQTLTELWDPQRDFAFLKLPTPGVRSVVALSNTSPHVNVVTSEGILYSYSIDLEFGGECVLQKTHNLLEGFEENSNSSFD